MTDIDAPAEVTPSGSEPGLRRWLIVGSVLVVVAAVVLRVGTGVVATDSGHSGSGHDGSMTSLAKVTRRSLSQTTQFNGTLGYAGAYTVLGRKPGTVTWLPAVGRVIRQGQVLYQVDEAPVVLLYGTSPAYRPLAEGASAADVTGTDVAQLNHDLVALGYIDSAEVDSDWGEFSGATKTGVERLQRHLGVDQTGELPLGDVVFLPTAARVTSLIAELGGPGGGSVLQASSTERTVSVALDPDLQSQVTVGDSVTITLPDGRSIPGRVTSVGKVAATPSSDSGSSGGGPTVPVQIRPTGPRTVDRPDQALVEVAITGRTVHNVLAVPVTALLARSPSGYSVEVVGGDGKLHLLRVRLGLFDDALGMVQASGHGLAPGQRVVVPGNE